MDTLFNDKTTINAFKQIQIDLLDLQPNSSEEEINNLISKISPNILNDKDNLMVVCRLFAFYANNNLHQNVGNAVKLFYKIIELLKTLLKDESSFFWNIFGGLLFFKLWMYEEGLITIEEIINGTRQFIQKTTNEVAEYFLPEIIEKVPEIFEKEIKSKIHPSKYSEEHLQEHKELRKKYFEWIKNSSDFNDPLYREIETNPLRYSIKTDDIESFQKILSNTNMDINSTVTESIIENISRSFRDASLISYAIEFSSIKIVKYLILKDAKLTRRDVFKSINRQNYEIIHLIESTIPDLFKKWSFLYSISCWNEEILEYMNDHYHLKLLDMKNDNEYINRDDKLMIYIMIKDTFFSGNFIFFDSYLLPFLNNNPKYTKNEIYEIIDSSLEDQSCYFLKEFLKYPNIHINFAYYADSGDTLLNAAIYERNENAIKILLKVPDIDINSRGQTTFTPFQNICKYHLSLNIAKLFCNDPKFDLYAPDRYEETTAFQKSVEEGCTFILDFLLSNFPELLDHPLNNLYRFCINENNLLSLKILLKYSLAKSSKDEIVNDFRNYLVEKGVDEKIISTFNEILDEFQ